MMRSSSISASSRTLAGFSAEPARAQRDLLRRLLAGDVEHRPAGRQRRERLQQQRRLADARVAADQHHAALDQAAAEHAVELVDERRQRAGTPRLHLFQRLHRRRRRERRIAMLDSPPRRATSTSVFQALQCGHCPCHLSDWRRRTRCRCSGSWPWPSSGLDHRHARRQRAHQLVAHGARRVRHLVDRQSLAPQHDGEPTPASGTGSGRR